MKTHFATTIVALILGTNLVSAQQTTGNNKVVLPQNATETKPGTMLCLTTISTCNNACNGTKPTANTCDPNTLKWNCQCPPGQQQMVLDQAFPIAFQECQSGFLSCVDTCMKKPAGDEQVSCLNKCNADFKCGTADAPKPSSKSSGSKNQDQRSSDSESLMKAGGSIMALGIAAGFLCLF